MWNINLTPNINHDIPYHTHTCFIIFHQQMNDTEVRILIQGILNVLKARWHALWTNLNKPLTNYQHLNKASYFFHIQLWFPAFDKDFWQFGGDFQCFCKVITGRNIMEEIELIMGAHVEWRICILQKSLAITHDFWNTNSLGWAPFCTDAHDRFSMSSTWT